MFHWVGVLGYNSGGNVSSKIFTNGSVNMLDIFVQSKDRNMCVFPTRTSMLFMFVLILSTSRLSLSNSLVSYRLRKRLEWRLWQEQTKQPQIFIGWSLSSSPSSAALEAPPPYIHTHTHTTTTLHFGLQSVSSTSDLNKEVGSEKIWKLTNSFHTNFICPNLNRINRASQKMIWSMWSNIYLKCRFSQFFSPI